MIAHLGHHDRCRGVVLKKEYRYIENNIVMATVEWSLDNNEKKGFQTFPETNFRFNNFKRFMGLKITLMKFIYPKG